MKPQKLKYSSTWWQIIHKGRLISGSDRTTKRPCIEDMCAEKFSDNSEDTRILWKMLKKAGYECVRVAAFWEVSK